MSGFSSTDPIVQAHVRIAYEISQRLLSKGIDVWLEYGSLLGAVRDGGVIKGDYDIDLAVWQDDWGKLTDEIIAQDFSESFSFVFSKCFSGGEICYCSTLHQKTPNPFRVDIFGFNLNDNNGWPKIRSGAVNYNRAFRSKAYYQKNLVNIKFENLDFKASKYAEKYLDYVYKDAGGFGKNWRTPVSSETVNWEKQIPSYCEKDKITGCAEGVFDMHHKGHVRLFQKMRQVFDKVVVAVTPDEIVKTYKEPPIFSFEERVEILRSCRYVDEVILPAENCITTIDWMEKNSIDYMAHGNTDDLFLKKWYKEPMLEDRLILFPETKDYHSKDLIEKVYERQICKILSKNSSSHL